MLQSGETVSKNKTQTISISTLLKKLLYNSCYLMTYLRIMSLKTDRFTQSDIFTDLSTGRDPIRIRQARTNAHGPQ